MRQDRDFAIKASFTDELTGIANRRFVTARVTEMIEQAAAQGTARIGSVALIDLDHFKVVNDRFGHATGDMILRDFARRILSQVRRTDCFGRFGGEEFVLVLPDTSAGQAVLILERMLGVIRTTRAIPERPDLAYTFLGRHRRGRAGRHAGEPLCPGRRGALCREARRPRLHPHPRGGHFAHRRLNGAREADPSSSGMAPSTGPARFRDASSSPPASAALSWRAPRPGCRGAVRHPRHAG